MKAKQFPLRVVLTVITDRLLTEPKNGTNGIGDLYEIIGWMTESQPHSHQLERLAGECRIWLQKWFPELIPVLGSMASLDGWISRDRTSDRQKCIKMWLAELRMRFPDIKAIYDVPVIPCCESLQQDPIVELKDMMAVGKSPIVITAQNVIDAHGPKSSNRNDMKEIE